MPSSPRTPPRRLVAITASTVAAAAVLSGCGSEDPTDEARQPSSATGSATGGEASISPAPPTQAPDPRHNEADAEFAAAALVHHRLSVELAEMLLDETGAPADLRALSDEVVAVRGPQTILLAEALALWGEPLPGDGPVPLGEETADFADLRALTRDNIRLLAEQAGTEEFVPTWVLTVQLHQAGLIDAAERTVDEGVSGTTQQVAEDYVASYPQVERTLGAYDAG